MRKGAFFSMAAFSVAALLAFRFMAEPKQVVLNTAQYKIKKAISCRPDWKDLNTWIEESDIPPIPGAGNYQWKISTRSDSAQFYFNQGINMYYGFHIIEAMASFKKAERFDPSCAMLYWAQALGYGPNINDFGYRASPEALAAVNKANELSGNASAFEKALIHAMSVRYTADSTDVTRTQLNQVYSDAMKKLQDKFGSLADAQALYADAMMLQHPWDLWNTDGTPKSWTPLIRSTLEKLLAKFPDHPGANHYYVHVMEPSPYASLALPSANRLGVTNPGLSHLVHMPSHIYLRTGNYAKGVEVNITAVKSYQRTIPLYAPVTGADFLYNIHNLHMKTNNAMMMGSYSIADAAAQETKNAVPADYLSAPAPMGSYMQYLSMTQLFVYIRFEKWDELLKLKQPAVPEIYAGLLYHFGRGMAFSARQKFDEAGKELDQLRELMKDSSLLVPLTPFSPAIEGARVAEQLLLGAIHLDRKLYDGAIRHFKQADSIEANMVYNEPRDWLLNPKHFLGDAYLQKGDAVNAEKVFRKDLLYNNENGWALRGLYQSLLAQNRKAEALRVNARWRKAFEKADEK
ncbi:MAG TPA: hypothetical protein PLZ45_08050 [Ferruginibacter sp.]|nr:hypothetical protein [Chitinophagaceae bacterium]HRI24617.1 hypothetical protein [Ferruginibacter sp.]